MDLDLSNRTSENENENESEYGSEESSEEQKIGTDKQMRYRHWVVQHSGTFDQLYSPVAIKKMRDTLEELVSRSEQMTFVRIS